MTDINKLIEDAVKDYQAKMLSDYDNILVEKAFKAGANLIIHQNRWRKVEEEMPEHSGNPFLVRGHFKINDKVSLVSRYFVVYLDMDFYKEFGKVIFDAPTHFVVTEWKPIEQK